jgi:hypothetical protein
VSKGTLAETIKSQLKADSSQYKVFNLLSDQQWHCRQCEGKQIASGQYAGGGGIQSLQRGGTKRPGCVIETISQYCENCEALRARLRYRKTKQDRPTGEIQSANSAANIPEVLAQRILQVYDYTDIIEQRKRAVHELVIDHRFPMERWGESEPPHLSSMSENEIKKSFSC